MEHRNRHTLRKKGKNGNTPLCSGSAHAQNEKRKVRAGDFVVISDLPASLPILAEEIGLLRAFLSAEINAILQSED